MADVDPALGQEILDVAQRQWVPHVHHYDQTDHFWRAVEIPERVAHGLTLVKTRNRESHIKMSSDSRSIIAFSGSNFINDANPQCNTTYGVVKTYMHVGVDKLTVV